ncbi:MAG: transmembrane adenylate cyclase, partial [Pseudomonadota bacterium]
MTAVASAPMEPGVVQQQLERILSSSQFVDTTRLARFLKYLVDQTLAGNDDALKGYSIGLDVFDKPDDFDPAIDTIVRVQASKLRSRLDLYYATDGAEDPLRILVPKGSYVPVFQVAFDPVANESTPPSDTAQHRYSIAVMPFDNLSGSPDQEFLADGFTEEILNALARFREFRVAARHSTFRYKNTKGDAREIGAELGV